MTPVINPLWFWLFDICGTLNVVFDLLAGGCVFGCLFIGCGTIASIVDEQPKDTLKFKSILKKTDFGDYSNRCVGC